MSTRFRFQCVPALAAVLVLSACGGGGDDGAGGGGDVSALTCNTAGYASGTVELPSAAQLTAYAGTYNGEEGSYGPNPGDPFVKSANATLVLGTDGKLSYKGTAYAVTSVCVDKVAGTLGKILYLMTAKGHFDVADKADATLGSAWGVSPVDGSTLFRNGAKQ